MKLPLREYHKPDTLDKIFAELAIFILIGICGIGIMFFAESFFTAMLITVLILALIMFFTVLIA